MDYYIPTQTQELIDKDELLPIIIGQTYDYPRFRFLESNREVDQANKNIIRRSLEDVPELMPYEPIKVNENWYILDGQHRFEDYRDAGLPVPYMVCPGLRIKHARQLNIIGKKWGPLDYAQSYAKENKEAYKKYLEFRNTFRFDHTTTISYLAGGQRSDIHRKFKTGDFMVFDEGKAREYMERLESIADIMGLTAGNGGGNRISRQRKFSAPFANALWGAFDHKDFEWEHFIGRFEQQHKVVMYASNRRKDYERMIEDVYNWNLKGKSNLRLW
jgi:hypothetical protein